MAIETFDGIREVPYCSSKLYLTYSGELVDKDSNAIEPSVLYQDLGLPYFDIRIAILATFLNFKFPPVYWSHLEILNAIPDTDSPENWVVGLKQPIESLEYPGFYYIPWFNNYLIRKDGRLFKKSNWTEITASRATTGYYTFRMTDDNGHTQNQLRHRILCYAFKSYTADIESLDVNHIDGIPGNDSLVNLEWVTRSENIIHAYTHGLRDDNRPVQIRDVESGHTYIFPSYSSAGKMLGVTNTTVSNRSKSLGYKIYDGFQFRDHPNKDPWPEIERTETGSYLVEFDNGRLLQCKANEAAMHAGLTRTSLLRMLREGRCYGTTRNKITRIT